MTSKTRKREKRRLARASQKGDSGDMGVYSQYLDQKMSGDQITLERKRLLRRIAELRGGSDVLAFVSALEKPPRSAIAYSDLLPLSDQLSNLSGETIDLILETPGGSGEVAEDIVRLLRTSHKKLGVIVPGWAKSAGTLIAMAADEILMEPVSALGPIDAQLGWGDGQSFSAHALIEGFEKIKEEVATAGVLNKAYIPVLQRISPGVLQDAQNHLNYAKVLVTNWLNDFKFREWDRHSSTGAPVTPDERRRRAEEIAEKLCDHGLWLTHGRSIKMGDLEAMRVKITDYSSNAALADAIRRYHTLTQMMFSQSNAYKIFETPISQIYRFDNAPIANPAATANAEIAVIEARCGICGTVTKVQANLGSPKPLQAGNVPFPPSDVLKCPGCGAEANLSGPRQQLEAQAKKPVVR